MGRQILPTGSNRAKNQGLKASNSRSSPTRAKEKPTGLNRRAGVHPIATTPRRATSLTVIFTEPAPGLLHPDVPERLQSQVTRVSFNQSAAPSRNPLSAARSRVFDSRHIGFRDARRSLGPAPRAKETKKSRRDRQHRSLSVRLWQPPDPDQSLAQSRANDVAIHPARRPPPNVSIGFQ